MNEIKKEKKCTQCGRWKIIASDFYINKGVYRANCKNCSIKQNRKYSKARIAMRKKMGISEKTEARTIYMRAYAIQNREKIEKYRTTFLNRHPEYYKAYYRNRRDKGIK